MREDFYRGDPSESWKIESNREVLDEVQQQAVRLVNDYFEKVSQHAFDRGVASRGLVSDVLESLSGKRIF